MVSAEIQGLLQRLDAMAHAVRVRDRMEVLNAVVGMRDDLQSIENVLALVERHPDDVTIARLEANRPALAGSL